MKQPRLVLFALILLLIVPSARATSPVPVEKHRLQGEIGSFHIMEGQDVLHPDQRDAALELGFGDQLGYVTVHTPWNKPFSLAFVPELGLCLQDGDSLQWVQLRYQGQVLDEAGIIALLSSLLGLSSENFEEAMEQKGLEGLGLLQDVLNKLAEPLAVQALVHKIRAFNPLSFSISTGELYTAFQQALILVTREAKQWAKAIAAWLPPTLQVTEDDVYRFLTSQSYALLRSWEFRRLPDVLLHASLEGQDHLIYLGAEELGMLQLAAQKATANGFTLMIPPVLVRPEIMQGTGFLGAHADEVYKLEADDLYLVGTSEVALAGYHQGEILDLADGPKRYVGWSSCFRREAGSHGKDTRGIIRVHQFDKVEMFSWCKPEDAHEEHKRLLAFEKEMLQAMGLPFRVIDIAGGDLGSSAARKYDCEAWVPTQDAYRELTSTSNCTTFQARRLGVRYRDESGKPQTAATLNGTLATTRWLVAILENHQQADGSVVVPEALRPFVGKDVLEPIR